MHTKFQSLARRRIACRLPLAQYLATDAAAVLQTWRIKKRHDAALSRNQAFGLKSLHGLRNAGALHAEAGRKTSVRRRHVGCSAQPIASVEQAAAQPLIESVNGVTDQALLQVVDDRLQVPGDGARENGHVEHKRFERRQRNSPSDAWERHVSLHTGHAAAQRLQEPDRPFRTHCWGSMSRPSSSWEWRDTSPSSMKWIHCSGSPDR